MGQHASPLRLMGVDPSYRRTGWAVTRYDCGRRQLAASGTISPVGAGRGQCLVSLHRQFEGVLEKQRPSIVTIEQPGLWMRRGTNRNTVEVMAMARGVFLLACAEHATPAYEVGFQEVRRVLLGNGSAPAEAVAEFARAEGIPLPKRARGGIDMDVANALMMAIYSEVVLDGISRAAT